MNDANFFLSKRGVKLLAVYAAALILLLAGRDFFFPMQAVKTIRNPSWRLPYRSGSEDSQNISLAINVDWGEEYLPDILAVLEENDISATFFLTGRWCDNNAALAKDIAEAGHELGNHGYSHSSPNASSIQEIVDEITRTEESIQNATGIKTHLFAPPSGEEEDHVIQAASEADMRPFFGAWTPSTGRVRMRQPSCSGYGIKSMGRNHFGPSHRSYPGSTA